MKDAKYAVKHAAYFIAPVWSCLIDAFGYGTAAPMQALIGELKLLYEIIKKYFSDFLLQEVKA
jgi:hypothetical protein